METSNLDFFLFKYDPDQEAWIVGFYYAGGIPHIVYCTEQGKIKELPGGLNNTRVVSKPPPEWF